MIGPPTVLILLVCNLFYPNVKHISTLLQNAMHVYVNVEKMHTVLYCLSRCVYDLLFISMRWTDRNRGTCTSLISALEEKVFI